MTKRKKAVLLASLEVILLIVITLLISFVWPDVLKPLVNVLCRLGIDDLRQIYVIFIVFTLVSLWFLMLFLWRKQYLYIKVALSYVIFFLCAFIIFLRFIVPQLTGGF
jgi:phosphoglycerol transferase MdoB-like AlkP superfamily enzyme